MTGGAQHWGQLEPAGAHGIIHSFAQQQQHIASCLQQLEHAAEDRAAEAEDRANKESHQASEESQQEINCWQAQSFVLRWKIKTVEDLSQSKVLANQLEAVLNLKMGELETDVANKQFLLSELKAELQLVKDSSAAAEQRASDLQGQLAACKEAAAQRTKAAAAGQREAEAEAAGQREAEAAAVAAQSTEREAYVTQLESAAQTCVCSEKDVPGLEAAVAQLESELESEQQATVHLESLFLEKDQQLYILTEHYEASQRIQEELAAASKQSADLVASKQKEIQSKSSVIAKLKETVKLLSQELEEAALVESQVRVWFDW